VLPRPGALQQALRAGLAPERLACLQPLALADSVESALVRLLAAWSAERPE
jgi:hypothetical protein